MKDTRSEALHYLIESLQKAWTIVEGELMYDTITRASEYDEWLMNLISSTLYISENDVKNLLLRDRLLRNRIDKLIRESTKYDITTDIRGLRELFGMSRDDYDDQLNNINQKILSREKINAQVLAQEYVNQSIDEDYFKNWILNKLSKSLYVKNQIRRIFNEVD